MRTIAHISDLHFGAEDDHAVAALHDVLLALRPDLIVVSGDLTQRARKAQFAAADAFLRSIEAAGLKLVVIPGNHDVPMHKPFTRVFAPLRRYRRMIQQGRPCHFADAEIAVLALASPHGLTVKDGRLTRAQVRAIGRAFADVADTATRLLVTHHPLLPFPGREPGSVEPALRGAERALAAARAAGIHILLAGHHHTHTVVVDAPVHMPDPDLLVVQAGTATSHRRRGTPNGFNLLQVERMRVTIGEWVSDGGPFRPLPAITYARDTDRGWHIPAA